MYQMLNRGKALVALNLRGQHHLMHSPNLVAVRGERRRRGLASALRDFATRSRPAGLRRAHPSLVCASLTGYRAEGPLPAVAAHDFNYLAEADYLGGSGGQHRSYVPLADAATARRRPQAPVG